MKYWVLWKCSVSFGSCSTPKELKPPKGPSLPNPVKIPAVFNQDFQDFQDVTIALWSPITWCIYSTCLETVSLFSCISVCWFFVNCHLLRKTPDKALSGRFSCNLESDLFVWIWWPIPEMWVLHLTLPVSREHTQDVSRCPTWFS